MAIATPSGISKEQFIAAMRFVYLREAARVGNGSPGVAAMDAYLENGGTYEAFGTPELRKYIDDLIDAATQNAPIGWNKGVMNWHEWACFCRFCAMLDSDAMDTVKSNLRKGFRDPWNVESADGRTMFPSPLAACAKKESTNDMYCCPAAIMNDPFYAGVMPGKQHHLTAVEWLLMGAGAVTAVGAFVWVGSERGWFGAKRAGSR